MFLDMILFFFFSIMLLISALLIITLQNSIYAILCLILSFIASTGLLFLLEFEFMGLIFIVIYVGAIAVLFLFIIMMLDIKFNSSKGESLKYFPIGNFLGVVFFFEIFLVISKNYHSNEYRNSFLYNFYTNWFDKTDSISDIKALGQILYTIYLPQFLMAGIVLLIAVIGSVILTLTTSKIQTQKQNTFKQVSR
nr:NADH dehydrogenase subunit 6 [Stephanopyxis turris]